jgi:hypothetical protein
METSSAGDPSGRHGRMRTQHQSKQQRGAAQKGERDTGRSGWALSHGWEAPWGGNWWSRLEGELGELRAGEGTSRTEQELGTAMGKPPWVRARARQAQGTAETGTRLENEAPRRVRERREKQGAEDWAAGRSPTGAAWSAKKNARLGKK